MTTETPEAEAPKGERTPETYGAAEAARVLGVSERRVRQLVDAGRLTPVGPEDGPLRIAQSEVIDLRAERRRQDHSGVRSTPGGGSAPKAPEVDVEALVRRVAESLFQTGLQRALEPARRAEESALAQAAEERALRLQAEAQLVEAEVARRVAEARLADLERQHATEAPAGTPREGSAGASGRRRTWYGKRLD